MALRELQPSPEALPVYEPEVRIFLTPEGVDNFAASKVITLLQNEPSAVLTLPTGSTPREMYWLILEAFNRGEVSFAQATIFNLDEYWPLPPQDPASYASYMRTRFINHIDIPRGNWHIPNSAAEGANEEATRFEALLQQTGGVDLAVLGIGPDLTCHIGFNEPGSAVTSRTRYVELDPRTLVVNQEHFPDPSQIPSGAITQGIADILEAKRILLLAKGGGKARGIARTLKGPVFAEAPASFLRYHPNVTFVLDRDAASLLKTNN